MEGTIAVFSEPGRGTSFHIILPITDEKPAADNRSTQSAVEGNGRILLVDDEEMINTAGYGILTQLGYNVTTADCGDRAIEIFSASPEDFDCVLTDIYMPGISGIDLAKKLKDIRHDIPVILSTGLYQKITHEDIKNANIAELVMKPMMASELSQAIRRAIKIH
jgi:CheY-like chemotaxis protein